MASTKAFTTQLVTLRLLRHRAGTGHAAPSTRREEARLTAALAHVPAHAADVLARDERLLALAETLRQAETVLYIGRGTGYPIAMEGALKLKELSYIHAEGFAAGELKHGPIALVDRGVPVIVVAPPGPLFDKTASNLREAAARGAHVVVISDAGGLRGAGAAGGGHRRAAHARPVRRAHPLRDPGPAHRLPRGGAEGD